MLSGSSFPPIGIALDQGFRTASITKYAHSVALVDFAYKGLPPYYPPLFFWVLGRLAAWTDTNAYEALKVGVLLTALVDPAVRGPLLERDHPRLGDRRSRSPSPASRSPTGTSPTAGWR